MKLLADHDYSNKSQHGMRWGLNVFTGPGYRMRLRELGGDLERLPNQDITLLQPTDRVLMMGNAWTHKDPRDRTWHDPRRVRELVKEFYFWDNPPLPHILYRGAHNPLGLKNWMRIVPQHWMPQASDFTGYHRDRINRELAEITEGGIQSWLDLVGDTGDVAPRGGRVMVVLSSSHVYEYYAQTTRTEWFHKVQSECQRQGLTVVQRSKQSRRLRSQQGELSRELSQQPWRCTISFSSMAVVESLLAGVPAVDLGGEPALRDLVTPWQEFTQGELRCPSRDTVISHVEAMFDQLWHKHAAYRGEWHE